MLITDNRLLEHRTTLGMDETEDFAEDFAEGFRALADPHRLKILHLLLTCGEMCACETMLALEMPQSNLSFHMKTLKQVGLVRARKAGRWMYYSLNRPAFEQFLSTFGEVFDLERWPDKPQCSSCDGAKGVRNAGE